MVHDYTAAPWVQRGRRAARRGQSALLIGLGAAASLVLAAWLVPPLLDWSRYRHEIAAILGARLGRPIVIDGDVALRLLPQPMLTAASVSMPDQGDGTSARIASVKLEVAALPLLAGKFAVKNLVLGSPVVRLPWPLPAAIVRPERPSLPHAFAALVENGTLWAGHAEIAGINASVHGGPVPTQTQDSPITAFGAEGFAAFDGHRWRFTAALGAPDADNVAPLDLAVHGEGKVADTSGTLVGTLANGVLQGRIRGGGADLALLMPAASLPWHLDAPFTVTADHMQSPAIALALGQSPAEATADLHLAAPAQLTIALHAGALDLDSWRGLATQAAAWPKPPVPVRIAFDADGATLLGGQLADLSGTLGLAGAAATLSDVQATLPGGGTLSLSGGLSAQPDGGWRFAGPIHLDAPSLRPAIAWLRPATAGLLAHLPDHVLKQADIEATADLSGGSLSLGHLKGSVDGAAVDGDLSLGFGHRPAVTARLHAGALSLDDWLGAIGPKSGRSLSAIGSALAATDAVLSLRADRAVLAGQTLQALALHASSDEAGATVQSATARSGPFALAWSGTLRTDGSLEGGRFDATLPDATLGQPWLPAAWRWLAAGQTAPFALALRAEGPPGALDLQLHAATGDLVAEAESRRDTLTGAAETTLTLRHPGAPFLLADWGFPHAALWLGEGPLTILAHLQSTPSWLTIEDFALNAGALRLTAAGALPLIAGQPAALSVSADPLPLPPPPILVLSHLPAAAMLASLTGDVTLQAAHVSSGSWPLADHLSARLSAAQQNAVLSVNAVGGASRDLRLDAAIDASQTPAQSAIDIGVAHVPLDQPLTLLPLPVSGGSLGLDLHATAQGNTADALLQTLAGAVHLDLRHVDVTGIDLPLAVRLLQAKAPRPLLLQALSSGVSDNFSGEVNGNFDGTRFIVSDSLLSSIDGTLRMTGSIDAVSHAVDTLIQTGPPDVFTLHLTGQQSSPARSIDWPRPDPGSPKPKNKK